MNETVIYPKRSKLLYLAAVALGYVVLGFYFALNRTDIGLPLWVVIITSYVGIPFFGLCLAYFISRLFTARPVVIINDEGLIDNASAVGAGMLRWEEIADIFPHNFLGQQMLGIILMNEALVIGRQSRIKRVIAMINRHLTAAPFNIPQGALPISIDELLAMIDERRRKSR